jgi:hypothetical protein
VEVAVGFRGLLCDFFIFYGKIKIWIIILRQ